MRELSSFTAELKFVVDQEVGNALRDWVRAELPPDPNAVEAGGDGYRTASLYFDTAAFDLFNRRGSTGRAKFRIRRYNSGPNVFLERKQKVEGRLSKRRTDVRLEDLSRLVSDSSDVRWSGRWFVRRLRHRQLRPVCQIDYRRIARMGVCATGPLRLTIDSYVSVQPINAIAFTEDPGMELNPGKAIVELKYRGDLPLLFSRLIEEFRLESRPFSKYRVAAEALGFPMADPKLLISV